MSEFLNCVLRTLDTPLISVCSFDYNSFIWSPSKYAEAGHINLPGPFSQLSHFTTTSLGPKLLY